MSYKSTGVLIWETFIQQQKNSTASCSLKPTPNSADNGEHENGDVDSNGCSRANKHWRVAVDSSSIRGAALILRLPRRLNLHCAFAGDMRPNPPRAFSLSHPDDGSAVAATTEMQNYVITCSLYVSEVIEIYNAAIG